MEEKTPEQSFEEKLFDVKNVLREERLYVNQQKRYSQRASSLRDTRTINKFRSWNLPTDESQREWMKLLQFLQVLYN
jgi:hypothetical protein